MPILQQAVSNDKLVTQYYYREIIMAKQESFEERQEELIIRLFIGVKLNDQEEVAKAISEGANPNGNAIFEPLHKAALEGYTEVAKLLIEKKADVHIKDKFGETPLHSASYYGRTSIVEMLLDQGADINSQSNTGATPLHDASFKGQKEVVNLLISRGAKLNVKDKEEETPSFLATYKQHKEVGKLLDDAIHLQDILNGENLNNPDFAEANLPTLRKQGKFWLSNKIVDKTSGHEVLSLLSKRSEKLFAFMREDARDYILQITEGAKINKDNDDLLPLGVAADSEN